MKHLASLLLLGAAVVWLQTRIDRELGEFRAQEEVLLWNGRDLKRLCPGFEGLMADIYWIRTVQYFGGQRAFLEGKRFDLLEPLVDATVTLDPTLEIAYRYGALFLSEAPPGGAGLPEKGIALLDRGVRALPQNWYMHQLRGFLIYFFLKDSERAAAALMESRKVPGSPFWLETMAADFLAQGGEREKSRRAWGSLAQQSEEGSIRNYAMDQIRRLDALDRVDEINRAIAAFVGDSGKPPRSLSAIRLPVSPIDPTGVPFAYDPATGTVAIAKSSKLWRDTSPPPVDRYKTK
jgi:hypothetical protein